MKKTKNILFYLLVLTLIFASCTDDDDTDPSNEHLGTYMGVLVGSSGYYTLELKENNSVATVIFDKNTYNLTTTKNVKAGQEINGLNLTDGTNSILFNAKADGTDPSIQFTIPGHIIESTIDISTGANSVELYEGTGESTASNGVDFIKYIYNLKINNDTNTFTILGKVTNSSHPEDIGDTQRVNGTITRTANTIILNFNGGSFTCSDNGSTLSFDDGSFEFSLVKVN